MMEENCETAKQTTYPCCPSAICLLSAANVEGKAKPRKVSKVKIVKEDFRMPGGK